LKIEPTGLIDVGESEGRECQLFINLNRFKRV